MPKSVNSRINKIRVSGERLIYHEWNNGLLSSSEERWSILTTYTLIPWCTLIWLIRLPDLTLKNKWVTGECWLWWTSGLISKECYKVLCYSEHKEIIFLGLTRERERMQIVYRRADFLHCLKEDHRHSPFNILHCLPYGCFRKFIGIFCWRAWGKSGENKDKTKHPALQTCWCPSSNSQPCQ